MLLQASQAFFQAERRYNYTTPKTFLELIKLKTEKLHTIVNSALSKKQSGQEVGKEKDREEKLKNAAPAPKALVPKNLKRPSTVNNDLNSSSMNSVMSSKSDGRLSSNWSALSLNKVRASEEIRLKFSDIEPLEMARQLTLIEYELFFKIQVCFELPLVICYNL